MKTETKKYAVLLAIIIVGAAVLGYPQIKSQIVQPELNAMSPTMTVTISVVNQDGCTGTVSPSGSSSVPTGQELILQINPNGCLWTYSDDRGGNGGNSAAGVRIKKICAPIQATVTFYKTSAPPKPSSPLSTSIKLIADGTVVVTTLDYGDIFPPKPTPTPSCKPNGTACTMSSECCSGYCSIYPEYHSGVCYFLYTD